MGAPVTTHRFTLDEYHRMGEAGIFHDDDRVELIDGQVVEMTPIGPAHAGCVMRLTALFAPLTSGAATLSIQNPVILGEYQEPQPDLALLRYRADGYRDRHPHAADVLLVIEVAETSVQLDRRIKIPLYARAGIPEAWLVDLPGERLEVYREPAAGRYTKVNAHVHGAAFAPLALPDFEVSVDRVLG